MFRSNWFGFDEWNKSGLKIKSTSSYEAVKLYDATLNQFACWYDDESLGGLGNTCNKLDQADPNFVLGQALVLGLKLNNDCYFYNETIKNRIDSLVKLAKQKRNEITEREYQHVEALEKMAKFDWNGAANVWENILQDHPNDMHAMKMCFYQYFFTGQKKKMFDVVSKTYPHFVKETDPYSKFIDGMLAFVLEETRQYREAEKYGQLALEKNPYDGWATHSLAHVYEMEGRFHEAINFMSKNIDNWTKSTHLACHNYWHLALHQISAGNLEEACFLFDKQILPRLQSSRNSFQITDASSLLWRLSFVTNDNNSLSLESKSKNVYEVVKPYLNKHNLAFSDVHFVMSCLASGHQQEAKNMIETLKTSEYQSRQTVEAEVSSKLMESFIYYDNHNYEKCVDTMQSIKDSIIQIGGSDAQRDVFNQLLIVSAFRSKKPEHQQLIPKLKQEREQFKKNDQFIQQCNRLYQQ